jgi:hypothetical protein
MFVATRSRGEMSAQGEAVYLALLLHEHKRNDGFAELAAEWLLSHRHAQMLGLDQLGVFGRAVAYESLYPHTAGNFDFARVAADIVPRFVLGECSETGDDDELYRLTNSALLRLIAIDSRGAVSRAHLAQKTERLWTLRRLARLGLVPTSVYCGVHSYLDRLRKLDAGLKAKLVLLVGDRIRLWIAALAALPRGTLTENPYLYCRSLTYLERLNERARQIAEENAEEWAEAYTEESEPEFYDYPE